MNGLSNAISASGLESYPLLYYQDILHEKNPNENDCAAFSVLYFVF